MFISKIHKMLNHFYACIVWNTKFSCIRFKTCLFIVQRWACYTKYNVESFRRQ